MSGVKRNNAFLSSFSLGSHTDDQSMFFHMPPFSLSDFVENKYLAFNNGMFVLYDKVFIDGECYDRLMSESHPSYSHIATIVRFLHEEGYIFIENYHDILMRKSVDLDDAVKNDLKNMHMWNKCLDIRGEICRRYATHAKHVRFPEVDGLDFNTYKFSGHIPIHQNHAKLDIIGDELVNNFNNYQVVDSYTRYINANLIIGDYLQAIVLDWEDFDPLYNLKGRSDIVEARKQVDNVDKEYCLINIHPRTVLRLRENYLDLRDDIYKCFNIEYTGADNVDASLYKSSVKKAIASINHEDGDHKKNKYAQRVPSRKDDELIVELYRIIKEEGWEIP
jgi:hypothetical protein